MTAGRAFSELIAAAGAGEPKSSSMNPRRSTSLAFDAADFVVVAGAEAAAEDRVVVGDEIELAVLDRRGGGTSSLPASYSSKPR